MCSSRLALDQYGRLIVIATSRDIVVEVGHVFLVVDPRLFGLMPERGRSATPEEQKQARVPYNAPTAPPLMREHPEPDDDQLAEGEAIRLARLEQQRRPPDLLQTYAA
ncbi:MAG: hypothetical protein H0W90_08240 [Actinobacteria bacterium]|nr:hypothetical protein [Actinomycetota bacterium]